MNEEREDVRSLDSVRDTILGRAAYDKVAAEHIVPDWFIEQQDPQRCPSCKFEDADVEATLLSIREDIVTALSAARFEALEDAAAIVDVVAAGCRRTAETMLYGGNQAAADVHFRKVDGLVNAARAIRAAAARVKLEPKTGQDQDQC